MANPFLVLGGIAISVATAAFGILQVPGWVASAQDASATNDLANVRSAAAAVVSQTGRQPGSVEALTAGSGMQMTAGAKALTLDLDGDSWCATVQSASGKFFAATGRSTRYGSGATEAAATADAGCFETLVCEDGAWSAAFFAGTVMAGEPLLTRCYDRLDSFVFTSEALEGKVPATDHSARFRATIDEGAGLYSFSIAHDDGVRVLIDDQLVYDQWGIHSSGAAVPFTAQLSDGPHDVLVEYWQGPIGGARVEMDWTVTR